MKKLTTLTDRTQMYLSERRRLGFELRRMGYALHSFASYVDKLDSRQPLTVEVMAKWARKDQGHSDDPRTWARRLMILRPFTRWLRQFEPHTEIPDEAIFGRIGERLSPHIYQEREILDLLAAARRMGPAPGLRGATYEALFGLIACTGLRVSEAVRLRIADVDLKAGMLTIHRTKFAKSRHVALHASATDSLRRYRRLRDRFVGVAAETPFFVGSRGRRRGQPLSARQVDRVFATLRTELGWCNRGAHHHARVHDLRHSFVVNRILIWQAQHVDIDQAMLALSTYVGHARVTNTYWYLTGVPELMALAAEQFESRSRKGVPRA